MINEEKEQKRAYRRDLKRMELLEVERAELTKELLASPAGQNFLWWLLQIGKVGLQPFTANALQTSFNCGELNVGNQILAHILKADPAGYVRMQQERVNAERTNAVRSDDTDGSYFGDSDDD